MRLKVIINEATPNMKALNIGNLSFALGAAVTLAALAVPGTSEAATIAAKYKQNASGACQAAFAASAGSSVRARPLAIQNEGATTAAITCAIPYDDDGGEGPTTNLGIKLINNNAFAVTINCTLVDGTTSDPVTYIPKSLELAAGDVIGDRIIWSTADYAAPPATIARPNISCALPAGTGATYVYYYYDRQVGA